MTASSPRRGSSALTPAASLGWSALDIPGTAGLWRQHAPDGQRRRAAQRAIAAVPADGDARGAPVAPLATELGRGSAAAIRRRTSQSGARPPITTVSGSNRFSIATRVRCKRRRCGMQPSIKAWRGHGSHAVQRRERVSRAEGAPERLERQIALQAAPIAAGTGIAVRHQREMADLTGIAVRSANDDAVLHHGAAQAYAEIEIVELSQARSGTVELLAESRRGNVGADEQRQPGQSLEPRTDAARPSSLATWWDRRSSCFRRRSGQAAPCRYRGRGGVGPLVRISSTSRPASARAGRTGACEGRLRRPMTSPPRLIRAASIRSGVTMEPDRGRAVRHQRQGGRRLPAAARPPARAGDEALLLQLADDRRHRLRGEANPPRNGGPRIPGLRGVSSPGRSADCKAGKSWLVPRRAIARRLPERCRR